MGRVNFNEIPMLNHWQVITSACISLLMHTQIPTSRVQEVLSGAPHPTDTTVCFLSGFFHLEDVFESQSWTLICSRPLLPNVWR